MNWVPLVTVTVAAFASLPTATHTSVVASSVAMVRRDFLSMGASLDTLNIHRCQYHAVNRILPPHRRPCI